MINPATGWIETCFVPEVRVDLVANQVDLAQLNRYSLPHKIIVDRGKDFLGKLKSMIVNDYGILCNFISTKNLQPNAIVEGVHQNHW